MPVGKRQIALIVLGLFVALFAGWAWWFTKTLFPAYDEEPESLFMMGTVHVSNMKGYNTNYFGPVSKI